MKRVSKTNNFPTRTNSILHCRNGNTNFFRGLILQIRMDENENSNINFLSVTKRFGTSIDSNNFPTRMNSILHCQTEIQIRNDENQNLLSISYQLQDEVYFSKINKSNIIEI